MLPQKNNIGLLTQISEAIICLFKKMRLLVTTIKPPKGRPILTLLVPNLDKTATHS